jgi:N-acetyl-anhydromuramyl-L-alanine amidase AmpD
MINILHNYKSPKFDDRPFPMQFLILHYTEMTFEGAVERLCDPEIKVSAHYIIKENGEIYSLVDDDKRAWHSGKSAWYDFERLNDYSIGIEIDNLGNKIFEEVQINSCIELCKYLCNKYSIPTKTNIIGHSDINPEGKIDPGIYFPWEKLAKENLGIFPKRELILKPEIVAHFGDEKEIIKEVPVEVEKIVEVIKEVPVEVEKIVEKIIEVPVFQTETIDDEIYFEDDFDIIESQNGTIVYPVNENEYVEPIKISELPEMIEPEKNDYVVSPEMDTQEPPRPNRLSYVKP